jgi:hypothetical protein
MESAGAGNGSKNGSDSQRLPPQPHRRQHPDDDNLFVAFRRYADEQISSFLTSVVGLPSVFTPSGRDWAVFRDHEQNKPKARWRHPSEEDYGRYHGTDQADHSERRYASHAFPSSVFDSIFDHPFTYPPFFRDFSHFRGPFMLDMLAPFTDMAWPIPYLLFSPYSPLHLERQQHLRRRASDHGPTGWVASSQERQSIKEPRWREAFEDLLRLENGKDMLEGESVVSTTEESGKDWLANMIKRGSLGEGWTHVQSRKGDQGDYFKYSYRAGNDPRGKEQSTDSPQDGVTELDLYDSFLHKVSGDFEDGADDSSRSLLGALLEQRRKYRQELQKMQDHWKEVHESRSAFRRERPEIEAAERSEKGIAFPRPGALFEEPHPSTEDTSSRVVSTTTRTERRTLADGSIRTKRTVNKRFADGHEENYETEEVRDTNNHVSDAAHRRVDEGSVHSSDYSQDGQKTGWFWK